MVPIQPSLMPVWNFDQQSHAQELKMIAQAPPATAMYATYMPALNRAGWYKFFFLEMLHAPDDASKLLNAFCADTYRPGILNHPDMNKRDRSEISALQARAKSIEQTALGRVREEMRIAMMLDPNETLRAGPHGQVPQGQAAQSPGSIQPGSQEDVALRMHKIQMERQFNDMAVKTVLGGGITFGPMGGSSGGYGSLV